MRRIERPAVIRQVAVAVKREERSVYRAELYHRGNWVLAPVWAETMTQAYIACAKLFPNCKFRVVPVR